MDPNKILEQRAMNDMLREEQEEFDRKRPLETLQTMISRSDLATALALAQAEMRNPECDSENTYFRKPDGTASQYISLAALRNATIPIAAKHGITTIQELDTSREGMVGCRTVLFHKSGQSYVSTFFYVPITKKDAQGYVAGSTYVRRISLGTTFCIVGEVDDDGETVVDRHKGHVNKPAVIEEVPAASTAGPSAHAFMEYLNAASTLEQIESTAKDIKAAGKSIEESDLKVLRELARQARDRIAKKAAAPAELRTVNGRTQAAWEAMNDGGRELNNEITDKGRELLTAWGSKNGISRPEKLLSYLADAVCPLPASKHGTLEMLWQVGDAWYLRCKAALDKREEKKA